jgi:hypothetical protein
VEFAMVRLAVSLAGIGVLFLFFGMSAALSEVQFVLLTRQYKEIAE